MFHRIPAITLGSPKLHRHPEISKGSFEIDILFQVDPSLSRLMKRTGEDDDVSARFFSFSSSLTT